MSRLRQARLTHLSFGDRLRRKGARAEVCARLETKAMSAESTAGQPVAGLLQEQDRLLRAVLDGTTDSVFIKDLEGRYLTINAAGARYIGRAVEEVLGRRDTDLFPAEVAERIMAHDQEVLKSGDSHAYEVTLPVDGAPCVFFSTKTPFRDATGTIVGLIGISRDITQRKQAEQARHESEERLARILECTPDAIITIDAQDIVRSFNPAAADVFRCQGIEVVGESFERFASPALRLTLARCRQAFSSGRVKRRYIWIPGGLLAVRADGEEFPIEAAIARVEIAGQQLLTVILRDVNERQQAQEELRRLKLENLYLHEEVQGRIGLPELVGQSAAMRDVHRAIQQVATTDSTVLITGGTGTGKELVARAIHRCSARREKILVTVNCAALPAGLVESELFGHEKGAFTGALARKIGRFELARGGTIFLDEIGDLPLELQAKLLRVLQEGEFERVGGRETLKVDVRVIAATNRELEGEIAAQRFRPDLYYRLNVFPIHISPLRERREDIPALIRHFTLLFCNALGKRIEAIPAAVMEVLVRHDWPGNVRELRNVVERAVIISPGPNLGLGGWRPPSAAVENAGPAAKLEEVEREHIRKTLEATHWRVSGPKGAAAILGLKPTTLASRMKKLGIKRAE
jgi:formate hydrogenlyase transcriptional activator